jgi:excisionase family DNA binding protein
MRDDYVSIGEAARIWGVSVETARRHADRGIVPTIRTPGGQRRFRRSDVERVLDDGLPDEEANEPATPPASAVAGSAVPAPLVPRWVARRETAAARLDATRSEIERREEIHRFRRERERQAEADREAQLARGEAERATAAAQAEAVRAAADLARVRQRQQEALEQAVRAIRGQLTWAPASERSEVERFLAENAIIGESIPWIEAEVAAIRERHRAEEKAAADRERQERAKAHDEQRTRAAAELQETCDQIRRDSLLRQADGYAQQMTADREEWDADSATDFREAVRERLAPIVKADWTERRVKREVEDELDAWD